MTSLIPNIVNNNVANTTLTPNNIQTTSVTPSQQIPQQPELSPEARSTFWSGIMCAILGSTWFAQDKIGGPNSLLQLDKDKFESATKKLNDLQEDSPIKQAFNQIKLIKEKAETHPQQYIEEIFKDKTELSKEELIKSYNKAIKSPAQLEKHLKNIETGLGKIPPILMDEKEVTEEFLKGLRENNYNKGYLKAFEKTFPIGSKPTTQDCLKFYSEYTKKAYLKLAEGKTISFMLNYANSEGKISRSTAQKALKQMFIDSELDNLRVCYEEIKSKLPKARLKGAAKWFGLGIGISILSNMVFSLFRKEPASK